MRAVCILDANFKRILHEKYDVILIYRPGCERAPAAPLPISPQSVYRRRQWRRRRYKTRCVCNLRASERRRFRVHSIIRLLLSENLQLHFSTRTSSHLYVRFTKLTISQRERKMFECGIEKLCVFFPSQSFQKEKNQQNEIFC